jgi:toxin ParE1/3/4
VKLTVLPAAELEAAEAAAWYDDRSADLGDEFLAELTDALGRIRLDPQSFSRLESYRGVHEIRRCQVKRFSYLIVFLCRPEETVVIAISHTRRRPLYWLERLG